MNGVFPVIGQDELSAKTVRALFIQSSKDDIGIADVWKARNEDSTYYKNDTIQLFNSVNARVGCWSVEWRMDKRLRMDLTRVHHCQEPPMQSLSFGDQNLSIRVSDAKKSPRITLRGNGGTVDAFEVIELKAVPLWEGGDIAHRLTLRRLHSLEDLQ